MHKKRLTKPTHDRNALSKAGTWGPASTFSTQVLQATGHGGETACAPAGTPSAQLFNTEPRVVRQGRKKQGNPRGRERKPFLFQTTTSFTEETSKNPAKKKKKLPERVTEFIQVTGHKVNPSQSAASLLGSNKQQKREMPTRKCHCLARTRPRPQDVRAERHRAEPHGPREARQLVRNVQGQERNVQTVTGTG